MGAGITIASWESTVAGDVDVVPLNEVLAVEPEVPVAVDDVVDDEVEKIDRPRDLIEAAWAPTTRTANVATAAIIRFALKLLNLRIF